MCYNLRQICIAISLLCTFSFPMYSGFNESLKMIIADLKHSAQQEGFISTCLTEVTEGKRDITNTIAYFTVNQGSPIKKIFVRILKDLKLNFEIEKQVDEEQLNPKEINALRSITENKHTMAQWLNGSTG